MNQSLYPGIVPLDRSFAAGTSLDVSEALRIQYCGSYGYATATLVASTSLTLYHGVASADTLDSTFGTAGAVDLSAAGFDTLGELVDAINKSPNWRAKLTGGLRDDLSANLLAQTVTSARLNGGLSIYFDGSDGIVSHAITGIEFKGFGSAPGFDDGAFDDKGCINTLAYVYSAMTETGGATLKVFEADDADTTATARTLYSIAEVDTTAQTIGDSASAAGAALLRSAENHRLIVRVTAATSLDSMIALNIRGACYDFRRGRTS